MDLIICPACDSDDTEWNSSDGVWAHCDCNHCGWQWVERVEEME